MIYRCQEIGINKPSVAGVDTDAAAFISAASITDSTQQTALDTLVKALKSASLWSKLNAAYPFVGGSASAHKFNLKNPTDSDSTFRLVFTGTWTHNANGATPDGSTAYANTFLVPSSVLSQNDKHLSVYAGTTFNRAAIGAQAGSVHDQIFNFGGSWYSSLSSDQSTSDSTAASTGLYVVTRNPSPTGIVQYRAGSSMFSNSVASTGNPNSNVFLGAKNSGTNAYQFSSSRLQWASIGAGLSAADVTALTNAVNAFQSAVSR